MNYEVKVTPYADGRIETAVDLVEDMGPPCNDVRQNIMRQVINTADHDTRAALIKLGWRPPGEIAAFDIPIPPSRENPLGSWRRVYVHDVERMERQLAAARDALKL